MTLEQAIEHAEDMAKSAIGCECRDEHRQLAEWLKELKQLREQVSSSEKPNKSEIPTGWIPCEKRLPNKLQDVLITFYDADGEYDVAYMRKTFNATYKAQGSENEWVSSMGETTYADYEVSAWMPIEPYMASPTGAESEG